MREDVEQLSKNKSNIRNIMIEPLPDFKGEDMLVIIRQKQNVQKIVVFVDNLI